jgi:hypothetical protein
MPSIDIDLMLGGTSVDVKRTDDSPVRDQTGHDASGSKYWDRFQVLSDRPADRREIMAGTASTSSASMDTIDQRCQHLRSPAPPVVGSPRRGIREDSAPRWRQ